MTSKATNVSEGLEPCPWCKEPAEVRISRDREISWGACTNGHCKASGPLEWSDEKAAAAWNRIATLSPPLPSLEVERLPNDAAYWRGRYEGFMAALIQTHTPEQLAEMGIV
jgi:hypothetical protein